ncbi:MAG: ATP-binding cassette domain-containing protein [Bdellovibrionota bacterium]
MKQGNSLLIVDHKKQVIEAADYIIDLGPLAGQAGGEIIFQGNLNELINAKTKTAEYLSGKLEVLSGNRQQTKSKLSFSSVSMLGFKVDDFEICMNQLNLITGESGSGKTLLGREIIYPLLQGQSLNSDYAGELKSTESIKRVKYIDANISANNPRSTVITAVGAFDALRLLYAELPESKKRGWSESRFSFNNKAGRCAGCEGRGEQKIEMDFLPPMFQVCEICSGTRYSEEISEVKFKGSSLKDLMQMSVQDAAELFSAIPEVSDKLMLLEDVGLGYLKLGQATRTLSGGEKQRIDLIKELNKTITGGTVFIVDEPDAGLHFADLDVLLRIFSRLVERENTVILLSHTPEVAQAADSVLKLEMIRSKKQIKASRE